MERSENINELAKALCGAQGLILPASKDSSNPFFKSKYADLAAVWEVARDPLYKNGLSVSQHPTADGNVVTVETVVTHSSGQWMSSKLTMTAKDASPQAIGSCITYIRRYSLSSILGIASEEDDDGNAATHSAHSVKPQNKPTDGGSIEGASVPEALTLKGMLLKVAKEKFANLDEFKAWRVDSNLPEELEGVGDFHLARIMTAVKSLPKLGDK